MEYVETCNFVTDKSNDTFTAWYNTSSMQTHLQYNVHVTINKQK